MTTLYTPTVTGTGFKASVQRVGGYLAAMVMPNIGAFIAWGLITALFIPTGWIPNEFFAQLVGPMILVLLPVLIGYTGGRLVHGQRGAVVGAVATIGMVVGVDIPMFLGAMIVGPLAAFILKMFDKLIEGKVKPGFEMLIDNFSAGIVGGGMALLAIWRIGPVVDKITEWAGSGVHYLVSHHLLPFASLIVEPGKVLFLNNAINHGVLAPLGVAESHSVGKSILFMIESNPGPGLGLLCAYLVFGPRSLRPTVPAAIIVQFLGGIHEIYFPYVLMKPRLILATIAGGAAGVLTFMVTGAGLVATPSPGSIFAYLAVTPRGGYFGVLLGIAVAAGVSFVVAATLLGFGRLESDREAVVAPDADIVSPPVHVAQLPVQEPASAHRTATSEA
jgi:PTS system mannitol-specific IIC component